MSAFKELREVSLNFQKELRRVSKELLSAKTRETFDEGIANKMRDLSLFSAKLKLLRAKTLSVTPQIAEQAKSEDTIHQYGDVAASKVLEQVVVKSLTRSHAVKALLCAPTRNLDPDLIDRKQQIIEALKKFEDSESDLRHMVALYRKKQAEHDEVRREWDEMLSDLRNMKGRVSDNMETEAKGPLYKKMTALVEKLEIMRCMLGSLVTARGHYDWLSDPHHRFKALKLSRHVITVDMFTNN